MASNYKKYYWDTCAWLGFINQEAGKVDRCQYVISLARAGNAQVWTSAFTLAEVFKKNCGNGVGGIDSSSDADFENYVQQDFLVVVQVDYDVGVLARRLLRAHPKLKKPADAIHLATAAISNVDELHTFDQDNLIPLSGKVLRADGVPLVICLPPQDLAPLFDGEEAA